MNWKELFLGDKKLKWLMGAGAAGILLIFLSGFWPEKQAVPKEETAGTPANTVYEERYQQQVEALAACIAGAGECRVLVTLESGVEYVYAKEESKSSDLSGQEGAQKSARSTLDQKTILVEDENGRKTALLRTTKEPAIRGVVIVSEGGGDPVVAQRLTEAVKTALGIPSTKVCVVPLSAQSAPDNK